MGKYFVIKSHDGITGNMDSQQHGWITHYNAGAGTPDMK